MRETIMYRKPIPNSVRPPTSCSVKWVCAFLWVVATVATAPTSIFSTVTNVAGEKLCLLKFPAGHYWLAFYHLQKILVAFVLPMLILSVSYLLLLRFVRKRNLNNVHSKRTIHVTKSITVVVLSFFLCWMPNHAITFWGVLVKLNVIHWDEAYYIVNTSVFPVTVCLAHTNSCLNPFIYCPTRRALRKKLKNCLSNIAPWLLNGSFQKSRHA
ncbi:relaxin-3 receptor 1-like [Sinocyclocheilus anshuiensis]|uniref:relaxin-3 receptor 1-like n=1 Tax=Sinocyclocheilus anshuiensis TaxID=1608454 RepID=UPI0007B973AB|nr:PREDICTED: relaxin-3 receptor 1-like [Sinocyclocheilus anshuiensis]